MYYVSTILLRLHRFRNCTIQALYGFIKRIARTFTLCHKNKSKTKTIQIKHATVVIDYIKALNNYKNLNDWSAQNVLSGNILINCHVPHFLHAILKNRRLLVMSEQSCIKNSEITSYVINPWIYSSSSEESDSTVSLAIRLVFTKKLGSWSKLSSSEV